MKLGLTLMDECRLKVFENWVQRIFGCNREKVAGSWRKLHQEEVHNMDPSPNVIRVINEGKRLLGRPGYRRKDNINMDHKERGYEGADWIHVAQDRVL
jgi:hypothetical protein